MNFYWERKRDDNMEYVFTFNGEFTMEEVANLDLRGLDLALLQDVGSDKHAAASNVLLVLEMLFRRHEQISKTTAPPPAQGRCRP